MRVLIQYGTQWRDATGWLHLYPPISTLQIKKVYVYKSISYIQTKNVLAWINTWTIH